MIMSFTPGDHIFKSYILTLTNPKILLTTFSCSQRETIFFVKMNNADVVTLKLVFVALSYAARGST